MLEQQVMLVTVYLKDKGYDILTLGRSQKVKPFFAENEMPFQYFDMNDEDSYNNLPTNNVETVVCLSACLAEHETPVEKFFEVNTLGVYKLLEFCRKNGIKNSFFHHRTKYIMTSTRK